MDGLTELTGVHVGEAVGFADGLDRDTGRLVGVAMGVAPGDTGVLVGTSTGAMEGYGVGAVDGVEDGFAAVDATGLVVGERRYAPVVLSWEQVLGLGYDPEQAVFMQVVRVVDGGFFNELIASAALVFTFVKST